MVWNTICYLDCVRDKVESLVRLSECSRARTKDNSRSCTIPCRYYYRWALSGTGEAVVAVKSDEAKLKFAAGRASRDRDSFSILSEQEGKRRKKGRRAKWSNLRIASPSKGPRFRPIVSWISSGLTLRITSRQSDHSRSSFSLFVPFSLPLYTHTHTQTHIKFDSASFNHVTCSCLS